MAGRRKTFMSKLNFVTASQVPVPQGCAKAKTKRQDKVTNSTRGGTKTPEMDWNGRCVRGPRTVRLATGQDSCFLFSWRERSRRCCPHGRTNKGLRLGPRGERIHATFFWGCALTGGGQSAACRRTNAVGHCPELICLHHIRDAPGCP